MKIVSRRDNFFRVLIFGAIFLCFAPMAIVYLRDGFTIEFLIGLVVITSISGLLVWVWHNTYYSIDNQVIKYNSGPFSGALKIDSINKITINKTSYVGLKYGLARNGIIIESENHINLYITPTQPQEFVRKLVEVNPSIEITA